jgi:hypothetical protein
LAFQPVAVSRLVPGKGIEELVLAYRWLRDLAVDEGLIPCGDGVNGGSGSKGLSSACCGYL